MKRTLPIALIAGAAVSVALGATSHLITTSSIGGGKLGQTRAGYRTLYGKPLRSDHLEGGLARVVYKEKLSVYFNEGSNAGRYIVVASPSFKTAKGIGPCSPAAAVKSTYPRAVKVSLAGPEYAYRLGAKLWFEVEGTKVAVVALGVGKQAAFIASNTEACSS
jgi:hypothetical protein